MYNLNSDETFKDIFELATVGVCYTSPEGRFIKVNEKFCSIVGYSMEEMLNMGFAQITYTEDLNEDLNLYYKTISGEINAYTLDKRYLKKDGSIVWVNLTVSAERTDDLVLKYFIGIIIDITEKKDQEKALTELNEKLEKRVEERTEELLNEKIISSSFIANMSHEIRTPLNAVIGFSEILYSQIDDVKHKNYLKSINTSGKSLLGLINDILDLSKIEAGMMKLELSPINPRQIIEEINNVYKLKAKSKSVDFIVDIDEDIPEYLLLDEIRLRQVLLNVVGNAIKFTEVGYVKISMKKLNAIDSDNNINLLVSVQDTGIGIFEKNLDNIFMSFKQQHENDNKQYGGTGLGLSISKKLVEMMNGKLTVESEIGIGSNFVFVLKEVNVSRISSKACINENRITKITKFIKKKVLIVDDVELNRFLLKEILELAGLETAVATNGIEAIKLANQEAPSLILMDVIMPEMGGIEATEKIKTNIETCNIPIIALTAMNPLEDMKNAEVKIFDGIVSKPINIVKLFTEISRYIPVAKAENIEKIQELPPELRELQYSDGLKRKLCIEVVPYIDKLKLGIKGNIAIDFSKLLISIGKEFNVAYIENKGIELTVAVECFDIIKINECIAQLDNWLSGQDLKGGDEFECKR